MIDFGGRGFTSHKAIRLFDLNPYKTMVLHKHRPEYPDHNKLIEKVYITLLGLLTHTLD